MSAGLAMQRIIEKEDLIQRSKEMSQYFLNGLCSLKDIDGITESDEGLLSNIVYDITFDAQIVNFLALVLSGLVPDPNKQSLRTLACGLG